MRTAIYSYSDPRSGRAGMMWRKALKHVGLSDTNFSFTSPDNPPMRGAFDAVITLCEPADGRAFTDLTGEKWTEKKRGYIYWSDTLEAKVLSTYDPAFIGKGKGSLTQALVYDLKVAPSKPTPTVPWTALSLHPTPLEVAIYVTSALSEAEFGVCDIETPYGDPDDEDGEENDSSFQILRVSLAYADKSGDVKAITFPYEPKYFGPLKTFHDSQLPVVYWNGDYDMPRLERQGIVTRNPVDAMWLFHFLFPDLPRSLAAGASYYTNLGEWKSLSGSQPELYSALDAYATAQCYQGIVKHLKQKGMWEVAWDHVVVLSRILRKMRDRGLFVDLKALEAFKVDLTQRLETLQLVINTSVPQQVRPTHTVAAKHLRGRCECLRPKVGKKGQALKTLIAVPDCALCGGLGWNAPIVETLDFKASSAEQVKALIRILGHKVPVMKTREGETKETTAGRFIDDLANRFPDAPYKVLMQYRKIAIIKNTFASWPLRSFNENYAVAATKLTLVPQTGRLSSVNPNMQNIPKEGELADSFKRCIVARPGHRICKRDYSGIEAVLTGYFSKDPEYMRLALLGVHTYRCAQYFSEAPTLDQPDAALAAALKTLKKKYDKLQPGEAVSLYQRFKKINHMGNYKAGPKKIFDSSPGVFVDLKEVRKLHAFLLRISQKRTQWWQSVERRCWNDKRIVTPYKYNRWFWDLPGDLTKAVAMEPQSTAAAIIKEAMLLVDKTPAGPYMVLQVHDELVFDFPIAPGSCACCPDNIYTWEELDGIVKGIMERPLERLGGIAIGTERADGVNYACKEEIQPTVA